MSRKRIPYIGQDRYEQVIAGGKIERVHKPQRAFSPTGQANRWTVELQDECVKRGFFFERTLPHNDVRIIPIRDEDNVRYHVNYTDWLHYDEAGIMDALLDGAAHNVSFDIVAVAFITQQDEYGYSGVWDKSVETYNPSLRWYKYFNQVKYCRDINRSLKRKWTQTKEDMNNMETLAKSVTRQSLSKREKERLIRIKKIEDRWNKTLEGTHLT